MAIELIKEAFKVEELKVISDTSTLLETEVYLSPSKPAIDKILWVQGKAEILNSKIIKDKLIINGLAKFSIIYRGEMEENNIQTLEAFKEFREELDVYGADEEMISRIKSKTEYIEWESDESKISLKALVNLKGEIYEFRTIQAIKEIRGKDSLQILKERVNYKEFHGRDISYALIKDLLRLGEGQPEIDEIIKFGISTKEVESMIVEDRIITSGELHINLMYYGEDKICTHREMIPFNHFIEMHGINAELKSEIEYEVVEGNYEVVLSELGERRAVDLEIKIRITGKAFEEKSRELIIDAYSISENILLARDEINIKESLKDIKYNQDIIFDVEEIDPGQILDIEAIPTITNKQLTQDGISIEGLVSLNIHFTDRNTEEISSYNTDFPFTSLIYEPDYDTANVEADIHASDFRHSVKKDGLRIEGELSMSINLNRNRKIYSISEIKETNEPINKMGKPSITVYMVQKYDTLWDIAKRYSTTSEDILASNGLTAGEIKYGDKIIIEKKVDSIVI